MNIRDAIVAELDKRQSAGLPFSRYWLGGELVKMKAIGNSETLMRYLRAERDTSSEVIGAIFEILKIKLALPRRSRASRLRSRPSQPAQR